MNKEILVINIKQNDFDQTVLLNSHKMPVFTAFLGMWSGSCITMENLLLSLAKEFPAQFIFAKIDIDEQPELRKAHKIENVPTLMIFKDGELKATEVGELKENEIRELLKDFGIFHESDMLREQARVKHMAGDTAAAINLLSDAIKSDPTNTRVAMDMVQVFIDINELEQANGLYSRLPESVRNTEMGKALNGQLIFTALAAKVDNIEMLNEKLLADKNDFDARFDLSVRQISQHQYNEAIDNLLYILKADKAYKDGAAKEMLVTISNMLTPVNDELAQDIKRRLANLLSE